MPALTGASLDGMLAPRSVVDNTLLGTGSRHVAVVWPECGQESARLHALILAQPRQRTVERAVGGCGDPTTKGEDARPAPRSKCHPACWEHHARSAQPQFLAGCAPAHIFSGDAGSCGRCRAVGGRKHANAVRVALERSRRNAMNELLLLPPTCRSAYASFRDEAVSRGARHLRSRELR